MTPEVTAGAAARSVGVLEQAWSTGPGVVRRARLLELSTFTFYVAGRAGVLGDCADAQVLAAALGEVAPEALRAGWEAAGKVGLANAARAWLDECAAWGAEALAAHEELAEPLARVVAAADVTGMPFAAAMRAHALAAVETASAGSRVALLVHALAELRATAMVVASRVVGLSPVEALIAEPEGDREAVLRGWNPPFPARLRVLRRHANAQAIADRLVGPAYRVLTPAERVELVGGLRAAAAGAGN